MEPNITAFALKTGSTQREAVEAIGKSILESCVSVVDSELECCADHIHALADPAQNGIRFMYCLKGKKLMLYEQFGDLKFKYNRSRGNYADTVCKNIIRRHAAGDLKELLEIKSESSYRSPSVGLRARQ